MRTIWKYDIPLTISFSLHMPPGAKILTVQLQGDTPKLWALVDYELESTERHFRLYPTGHVLFDPDAIAIDAGRLRYVNTFQFNSWDGPALVYHLFQYEVGS